MESLETNADYQATEDVKYMTRCLQLAIYAAGHASPNPMVGCVIVHNKTIIGEGYTSAYGGSHAEVNAISAVHNAALLPKATLYVTLEPCAHYGKTPPCAELIIASEIPEVVIGVKDPHSKVSGKGIKKLKDAGCTVRIGVLEDECRNHHRRFLTYHEKNRPYLILKWAQSVDGFMAPDMKDRNNKPEPFWLTNKHSRQLVHKWRSEEQALLVGTNTILQDNPKLNTRNWAGRSPIRIFIDKELKVHKDHHVFDGTVKTIVIAKRIPEVKPSDTIIYEVINFDEDILPQLMTIMYKHKVISVIIEGGAQLLESFIDCGLWDEARIFTSPNELKKGLKAPIIQGLTRVEKQLLNDELKILFND